MVAALRIESVVLHGIVKSIAGGGAAPELSDVESAVTDRIRGFLQEQIQSSLKWGRDIVEEPGMSSLPAQVRAFWNGESSLLACSRNLAVHLQDTQPSQSPEGLLMVADARAGKQRVFVIAKLEHERGAQAHREPDSAGNMVYNMRFLDDLFFTTGSKVFKIGYFPLGDDPTANLSGLVVDRQAQAHHVARYFRERYLGCVWKEKPELVTERFYNAVQAWIDTVPDSEKRARYQVGLLSELQSQETGLSVSGFANRHLDQEDRDPFEREAHKVLPFREFTKAIDFVRSKILNVQLDTDTGVLVIAPPERLQDETVVVGADNIEIRGQVTKTSGQGAFRGQ